MIKIFDNLFLEEEVKFIESFLISDCFPWFLSNDGKTVCDDDYLKNKTQDTKEYLQFCHVFYDEHRHNYETFEKSIFSSPIKKIINKIQYKKNFIRIKANLQTKCESFLSHQYNTPHIDSLKKHITILYYVNDSDGDTFFFDKNMEIIKRVNHIAGRLVIFDGNILHSGSHPINSDKRITINFNINTNNNLFLL